MQLLANVIPQVLIPSSINVDESWTLEDNFYDLKAKLKNPSFAQPVLLCSFFGGRLDHLQVENWKAFCLAEREKYDRELGAAAPANPAAAAAPRAAVARPAGAP